MDSKQSPAGFVPLVPLQPAELGVYLELEADRVTDSPGAGFSRLPGDSPHTRCLRGAVLSASGHVLTRVVVKLRQDEGTEGFFPDEVADSLATSQDAWWSRTLHDLARLQGGASCFPDLVLPAPCAHPQPVLPPLLYCGFTRLLFPIPCPRCLEPLRTCRSDALLVAAGLHPFTAPGPRFLSCPSCQEAGREGRFYATTTPNGGEARPEALGDASELHRGWAEAVSRAQTEGRPVSPAVPCAQCAMAGSCLGTANESTEATGRRRARSAAPQPLWKVFLSLDSPYLVTRLVPSTLDAFADRLGGRPASETPGAPGEGGFLFGDEGSGLDAVEVLALKAHLFLQVLRAVREYHRRLGIPHLDLHPDHLLVDVGEVSELLPALWSFRVKLLGTSGTREQRLGEAARVILPPQEARVPFASPRVRAFTMQTRRRAELTIERVTPEAAVPGSSRFEALLRDPHGLHLRPSTQDWLLLSFPDDSEELGVAAAAARVDPRQSTAAGGELRVTSEPVALAPSAVRRVERSGGIHLPVVRYRVFPLFADVDDAFSLGVILLRLLLVNDQQDLAAVAEVVAGMVRKATAAAPVPVRSGAFLVESALGSALAAHPQVLAKSNLFYRQMDRVPGRPHALPEAAWRGALIMAFRLLEMGLNPGTGASAIDPSRLDAVIAECEGLVRQLHTVLFRRQGLNLEVQALIEELVAADPSRQH